jgi:L-aminopeptidase/D-esterase-like protein
MQSGTNNALTDVTGLEVGHYTDLANGTGCTVVLARGGATGGVDVRGSAPGTRETDVLRAENSVTTVQAVVLSGGSAYGLSTADGVMRYLEERGIGHRVRDIVVPIVPAAILFDLGMITSAVRPGPDEGYQAAVQASAGAIEQGSVGAGTGAVVGKALGRGHGMKGGIGTASVDLGDGVIVSALVAVNAIGGVVDHATGEAIAGPRDDQGIIKDSFEAY